METSPFILVRSAGLPISNFISLSIEASKITKEQWESIKQEHFKILLAFSRSMTLQNGLLYSSHSFSERIDQLHKKNSKQFRKKEAQTIRRLTQYLGRVCGKTVPFSSFSTISLLDEIKIFESKRLLNIQVLQKMVENEDIIVINPTFHSLKQDFVWLSLITKDKINISQKEETISLVIQSIGNQKSKHDLADGISEKYDIEYEALLNFIDQLIDSEILVINNDVTFETALQLTKSIISNEKIDKPLINQFHNKYLKKYPSLNFPKETFFYEHQHVSRNIDIKTKELSSIKTQLNALYHYLYSYHQNDLDWQLLEIWNRLEIQENEVEFIDFYQMVLDSKIEIPPVKINYDYQLKKTDRVVKVILPTTESSTPSFGAICQIFSQNGLKSYLNNFTTGYGKYFGRFIPMFPSEILDYIKEKNHNSKYNLVSNKNFHPTNVDLHPKIIQSEIDFSQSIIIKKIEDKFELYQNGLKIKIIDLSIEHPKLKSIRYQLLNLFGFPNISKNGIVKQISEEIGTKTDYCKYIPQIEYNDIILQRERWIINLTHLVNPNIKSKFQYFEAIQEWKNKIGVNEYCYVSSKDHPKLLEPQLINFNSPHFVELFKSFSRKVTSEIVLEKMMPQPDQLLGQNEASFLHEFLIEFEE